MKYYSVILWLFIPLWILACRPSKLTEEELVKYVMDSNHGTIKIQERGGYKVVIVYRPTDILVAHELGGDRTDEQTIEQLRSKYRPHYYFTMHISANDQEVLGQLRGSEFSEMLQTMAFRMGNYVELVMPSDTIVISDFVLDRTHNVGASTDVLLIFGEARESTGDWVQVNINEFGLGLGNLRFRFNREDLDSVPTIY